MGKWALLRLIKGRMRSSYSTSGRENWTLWRKTVSREAMLLARPLTEVKEPLSG